MKNLFQRCFGGYGDCRAAVRGDFGTEFGDVLPVMV